MKTPSEILDRLIALLCAERGESVPDLKTADRAKYYRALVNVRPPIPASAEFLALEDEYLQSELRRKGVTDISDLSPIAPHTYL